MQMVTSTHISFNLCTILNSMNTVKRQVIMSNVCKSILDVKSSVTKWLDLNGNIKLNSLQQSIWDDLQLNLCLLLSEHV